MLSLVFSICVLTLFVAAAYHDRSPTVAGQTGKTASFTVVVEGDKIISGPTELRVLQGENVTINITGRKYGEDNFWIQTYDQRGELDDADGASKLEFVADKPGNFPIVVESTGAHLGTFVVTARR